MPFLIILLADRLLIHTHCIVGHLHRTSADRLEKLVSGR